MAGNVFVQNSVNKAGQITMMMAIGFWCGFGAASLVNEIGFAFIDGYAKLEFWKLCTVGACGAFVGFIGANEPAD